MSSESPGGTQSQLLYSRLLDSWIGKKNLTNWKVTSLHYWGENPIGDWYFTIRNSKPYRNSRNAPDFRRVRRRLWTGGIAINGNYSAWSQWSLCTRPCNGGWQNRSRECNNPSPSNGGNDCSKIGLAVEYRKCNSQNCSDAVPPVHGGYTLWSHWGKCTKPCNGGTQTRSRTCTNPPPAYGGRGCFQQGLGRARDERRCNTHRRSPGHVFSLTLILYGAREDPLASNPHVDRGIKKVETVDIDQRKRDIPVHGGWSQWSYWRPCDRGCGGGIRTHSRSCNNPVPADGGRDCCGSNTQSRSCNRRPCPVHGGYARWSTWGVCSKSCDRGSQHRHRTCTNPRPAHGGRDCSQQRGLGPNSESRHCSVHRCPAPTTNASCENNYTDDNCKSLEIFCGTSEDVQENCAKTCKRCPVNGGYSQWSSWSECNVTCGGGNQTRNRSCSNPPPENGGAPCTGHSSQTRTCNTDECPVTDCLNLLFGDAYCNRHTIRWCRYQWFSKYCKKSCGLC